MPAQRADRDARLGQHRRECLRGGDVHQGVSAARRPASHQRPVGQLDHRRLPEDPVRAVEFGLLVGHRFGRMRPGRARMGAGLPPALPIRDKAQAPIQPPGRLPHRLVPASGHRLGCTGGDQLRGRGGSVDHNLERDDDNGRGVPRHVRVVPGHRHQTVPRVIHPRGTIEIMALGHDRFTSVVGARPQGHQAVPGTRAPRSVGLAHGHDPIPVGCGAEPTVGPDLSWRGLTREGPRCSRSPLRQPDPLVIETHIGERLRAVTRDEA